jgi:hypothetical protein
MHSESYWVNGAIELRLKMIHIDLIWLKIYIHIDITLDLLPK